LHDLLLASTALITFHSTTNIEALLLGIPVITAAMGDLAASDRLIPLERYGLPLATSAAQLNELTREAAAFPVAFRSRLADAMRHARAQIATGDSRATDRVCQLIQALLPASNLA